MMLTTFQKEMIVVLALKCVALFLLWFFFFSHPIAEKLDAKKIAEHFHSTF